MRIVDQHGGKFKKRFILSGANIGDGDPWSLGIRAQLWYRTIMQIAPCWRHISARIHAHVVGSRVDVVTLRVQMVRVGKDQTNSVHGAQSHLEFLKICISSCLSKFYNEKNFTVSFLKYKRLKLKLRVSLAGHSVAMVTYWVTKIIPTRSPVIGSFLIPWL